MADFFVNNKKQFIPEIRNSADVINPKSPMGEVAEEIGKIAEKNLKKNSFFPK